MDRELIAQIKEQIDKAGSIVINMHRNPDLDSAGSALALYHVLRGMNKKVKLIGPDPVPDSFDFLPGREFAETVDMATFRFGDYDLFLIIDTGSLSHLTGKKDGTLPAVPAIVIDHHVVNTVPAEKRFIMPEMSSTAEVIYNLLTIWNVPIDQQIATCLLAGILSDTQMFRFTGNNAQVMETAAKLVSLGGDKVGVTKAMYENMSEKDVKFYGKLLTEAVIDKQSRFIMVTVPYETYKAYGEPKGVRNIACDYLRGIKDIEFAVVGVEELPGQLFLSFRSKGYDVSQIALKLGGGGHKEAAGATVYDVYETAVYQLESVLSH